MSLDIHIPSDILSGRVAWYRCEAYSHWATFKLQVVQDDAKNGSICQPLATIYAFKEKHDEPLQHQVVLDDGENGSICQPLATVFAAKVTPSQPPSCEQDVYLAVSGGIDDTTVLTYEYFGTHGYIPSWDTSEAAVDALRCHWYGETKMPLLPFKMYNFRINCGKDKNLYLRPDKYNRAKTKLFFPLPMSHHIEEKQMQEVWYEKYRKPARWRDRYNWQVNLMCNIMVEHLHHKDGTLEYHEASGQFWLQEKENRNATQSSCPAGFMMGQALPAG